MHHKSFGNCRHSDGELQKCYTGLQHTIRNIHRYHKIRDWSRAGDPAIFRHQALMSHNRPVYMNLNSQRRETTGGAGRANMMNG